MDRLVDLDMKVDFVSKTALKRIKDNGVEQKFVGLVFDGLPLVGSNDAYWNITHDGQNVGWVTSAIYSPRLEKNIALAMVSREHCEIGTALKIDISEETRNCVVVPKPFYDPNKSIAAKT